MSPARLDIVIVNWNAGPLLEQCVASVLASRWQRADLARLVVVDNRSTDGSADFAAPMLQAAPPPLRLIANPVNRGFAAACNMGAAGSQADYLLFLNPDVRLDADSLEAAVAFMERPENATVAVSGIRLRDETGRTQRCCARYPTPRLMLAHAMGLDVLFPRLVPSHFLTEWDHQDTRDVPQVMGAFLLIRRTVFERLGGFDERFFVYYEDVDLCRRATLAGGRCVHDAEVSAVHLGGGTTNSIPARRQFLAARSRVQYAAKHFGRAAAVLAAAAGLVLEPLARLARAALRRAPDQMASTLAGAAMLWRALPELAATIAAGAGGGEKRHPGRLSVLALTRYPRQGASSRLRFLDFLPGLAGEGLDVAVSSFFDDSYLPDLYAGRRTPPIRLLGSYLRRLQVLAGAGRHDLVWIEKEALPWLPAAVERLLLRRAAVVLDFDDAWHLRYAGRPLLDGKLERLVARSRLTVAGSAVLAQWAGAAGAPAVAELPTVVDPSRYRPAPLRAEGPLRIGWIGSPSSARACLRPLAPVLAEVTAAGWAGLTLVGAGEGLPGVAATLLPWREDEEAERLARFDVGIMPLQDDAWSRGKCAYKLIQYMAAGLPVVASPVGANRQVVRPGVNGFLAAGPEEWRAALRQLADDPDLRRRMGAAGRRIVEEEYSLAAILPRLAAALKQAAS